MKALHLTKHFFPEYSRTTTRLYNLLTRLPFNVQILTSDRTIRGNHFSVEGVEPEGWENRLSNLKVLLGCHNIRSVPEEQANYVLISDIIKRRAGVVNIPIPDVFTSSTIYAAGDVAIYNKVSPK